MLRFVAVPWGLLKENIAKESFIGWFVRLVIQEIFVMPWPEVGKNVNLLPSTQQVNYLAYFLKKGRVERSMLTTFDLWKGRGRRHGVS